MRAKLTRLVALFGLLLFALYLALWLAPEQLGAIIDVERSKLIILIAIIVSSVINVILDRRRSKREPPLPEPSPASSGAFAILATGFAAAAWLGYSGYEADGWPGLMVPLAIAVLTVAIALTVARFARRHEGEIGEARFDTNKRSQPGA